MRNFILIGFLLSAVLPDAKALSPDDDKEQISKRAWLIRPSYQRQDDRNFLEIGFGRIHSHNSPLKDGKSLMIATAGFTFGAEFGYGGTSLIIAPKMGIEVTATIFGGRISYAYYMQDNNATGVIGLEGGICFFGVMYAYGGYNFVKGNPDNPVIREGAKLSIGFNIPLGARAVAPAKKVGEK